MTTAIRWEVERAVLASELSSQARLVVFVLLSLSDAKTGVIPAEYTPSLSRLVKLTSLGISTVKRALNELEEGGWIIRMRPEIQKARIDHERTQYRITAPGMAHPGPSPAHTGPRARSTQGQGLGPEGATSQNAFQTSNQTKQAGAEAFVSEATGATAEEAEAIVKRIRNGKTDIKTMGGFLQHLATAGELRQYLTDVRASTKRAEDDADRKVSQRQPQCEHGKAGGGHPHTRTGEIRCKPCREIQALQRNAIRVN